MKSNRLEDYYIIKDGKKLRYGYTTGSCAVAAAKAATLLLLDPAVQMEQGKVRVELLTPKGILLKLLAKVWKREADMVTCSIRKFAGDDPDVTDGLDIFVTVKKCTEAGIHIEGGRGVGRVTRSALEQPVGSAAINKVPREEICKNLRAYLEQYQVNGGLEVLIEVPDGDEIAKRTFNPRLGIIGGISILGSSGIVVPMSEEALIKSIEIEINMQIQQGRKYLLLTPGNYGEAYLRNYSQLDYKNAIKVSNYIGKSLEISVNLGAKGVLLVGHIGKLVKISGGIMNTHSKESDARMELLVAHAIRAGADIESCRAVLEASTTDEAIGILEGTPYLQNTKREMMVKMHYYLNYHIANTIPIAAITFSNEYGFLGETELAGQLFERIQHQ